MSRRRKKKKEKKQPLAVPAMRVSSPSENLPSPAECEAGWVRLKLTAELTEDAHPGSGSGGGGIDALVARDRDGRPVIWASHLVGLLREAVRRLQLELEAKAGDLFGRRGGRRRRVVFTSLYAREAPTSRVWRSSSRASFDNRAPKDETLRAVEYVPKGTRFEGWVEAPSGDVAMLRRLVRELDAVGSGRASGAGRLTLDIEQVRPMPRAVKEPNVRLVLLLRNLDPVCVAETATPGNLVPSLPFIPGRTLLGALAAWLIEAGERDAASLLVGGEVSVSDALPVPNEPQRLSEAEVLSAPLCLRSEKPDDAGRAWPWWSLPPTTVRRIDACRVVDEPNGPGLKRPEPDLFVYRTHREASWETYRPFRRVRLRNGRPEGPEQLDPSLFAVEQIVERTLFLCEVRGKKEDMERLAGPLRPVLEGCRWLRMGRGGAPVEVAALEWSEPPPPVAVGQHAYLILTSDLLVRDNYLRWKAALDEGDFHHLPGWPQGIKVKVKEVAQETLTVHGFNGTSRLWRLPASGVRRGSVFIVEGEEVSQLAQAAAAGRWLGERTYEGFGRFRLDETLPGVTVRDSKPYVSTLPTGQIPDDPAEAIAAITRGWFESHRCLAKPGNSFECRPSLSQWQDLLADLERKTANALSSRLQPTTAGGRNWLDRDARAILEKLEKMEPKDRVAHARMFIRWLRAGMRKETRGRDI